MKILVTGGAGYIGSHACKALAAAGHEPVVFDSLLNGHEEAVKWGPLEVGDTRDGERVGDVLDRHKPDLVMHFAALAYVGDSMREPSDYYDVNIWGTLSLLQQMQKRGIDKFVFSSTCATYGVPDALPISEETPQEPCNPYGRTKLMVEKMLADFDMAYGLKWSALRYFNAAGADPDGEIGELHEPETHAIPLAIMAALGQIGGFSMFGTDYPTPDGSAVRDYIHVTDLADAHVKAAEYLAGGGQSVALNLGTGQGTSVIELIESIERIGDCKVPLTVAPRRPGDPPSLYATAEKARATLGWSPRFTLDDIVGTALDWHRRHPA